MDALSPSTAVSVDRASCKPFDLNGLKTYDLKSRPSKLFLEDLGRASPEQPPVADWIDSLPHYGAGNNLRLLRDRLCQAIRDERTIASSIGRKVIECGGGPYLVDWLQRGVLRAVALSGAAA